MFGERFEAGYKGPQQLSWLCQVDGDLDNIRGALAWALQEAEAIPDAIWIVTSLRMFWFVRCRLVEGVTWLEHLERWSDTMGPLYAGLNP